MKKKKISFKLLKCSDHTLIIITGHPNPREVEALHLQDAAAAADPMRRVGHGAQEDEGVAPVLEIKTQAKEEGADQNLMKMIQQVGIK